MKLIKILTIVLFFSTNVLADTIYYLLKIPNLEMVNFENNNQIKTFKAKKYFKVGIKDNNVEIKEAKKRNLHIIDATCPLVTKVHRAALRYSKRNVQTVRIVCTH